MTPERFRKLRTALDRRQPDLALIAENVHKSHNLSALLRTCDAVGVPVVHAVSDDGAVQRHRGISGGSRHWVEVRVHESVAAACATLESAGFEILAAHFSAQAVDYRSIDYTRPSAILLGSELDGVSAPAAALADRHIVIPMHGMVASLNVSVAAAVILYEAERQRVAAGCYGKCRLKPDVRARILFEWCYPRIAASCRLKGVPYPSLDTDGSLRKNPLLNARRRDRDCRT
ncbi:MAG: tRNA (guanosine(18)-2'-O)-methyltransferase TrmH [Gammaproteobacteria bacterium]